MRRRRRPRRPWAQRSRGWCVAPLADRLDAELLQPRVWRVVHGRGVRPAGAGRHRVGCGTVRGKPSCRSPARGPDRRQGGGRGPGWRGARSRTPGRARESSGERRLTRLSMRIANPVRGRRRRNPNFMAGDPVPTSGNSELLDRRRAPAHRVVDARAITANPWHLCSSGLILLSAACHTRRSCTERRGTAGRTPQAVRRAHFTVVTLRPGSVAPRSSPQQPDPPPAGAASQTQPTVLVVDDEPEGRSMLVRAFRRSGYTVIAAADGHEALATAEDHAGPLDLVLTDVKIPGHPGGELLRALGETHPPRQSSSSRDGHCRARCRTSCGADRPCSSRSRSRSSRSGTCGRVGRFFGDPLRLAPYRPCRWVSAPPSSSRMYRRSAYAPHSPDRTMAPEQLEGSELHVCAAPGSRASPPTRRRSVTSDCGPPSSG
jgi:CheY-like chemotaxis protein